MQFFVYSNVYVDVVGIDTQQQHARAPLPLDHGAGGGAEGGRQQSQVPRGELHNLL